MQFDDLFPIEHLPLPVRDSILDEFQGHHPTVQEVESIPDRRWLATPAIGPTMLEKIHHLARGRRLQADALSSRRLTDADLLARLDFLQKEVQRIRDALETKIEGSNGS